MHVGVGAGCVLQNSGTLRVVLVTDLTEGSPPEDNRERVDSHHIVRTPLLLASLHAFFYGS